MKPMFPHPDAEAEFLVGVDYYDRQRDELGDQFRIEIERAVARIEEQPNRYPLYEDTPCRECQVWTFPYAVYYVERPTRIWIVAIANQYRRPGYWKTRLKDVRS